MTLDFRPNVAAIRLFKPTASITELAAEQGVYSATPEFIRRHCGPIANMILDQVPSWYYDEAKELGLYPNCDIRMVCCGKRSCASASFLPRHCVAANANARCRRMSQEPDLPSIMHLANGHERAHLQRRP